MIGEQWRGACVRHVGPVCATSEIPLAHAFIRFSEPFSSFASGKQFHGHANHTSVSDVDDRGLFSCMCASLPAYCKTYMLFVSGLLTGDESPKVVLSERKNL